MRHHPQDHEANVRARKAHDSTVLHDAARILRERIPRQQDGPLGEYAIFANAKLLDAVAAALDAGEPLRQDICTSALEIAHHVRRYPPSPDPT